jgi:hypothetical protein
VAARIGFFATVYRPRSVGRSGEREQKAEIVPTVATPDEVLFMGVHRRNSGA